MWKCGIRNEYCRIERQLYNLSTPVETSVKIDENLNFDEKFQERPTLITSDDDEHSIYNPGNFVLIDIHILDLVTLRRHVYRSTDDLQSGSIYFVTKNIYMRSLQIRLC